MNYIKATQFKLISSEFLYPKLMLTLQRENHRIRSDLENVNNPILVNYIKATQFKMRGCQFVNPIIYKQSDENHRIRGYSTKRKQSKTCSMNLNELH